MKLHDDARDRVRGFMQPTPPAGGDDDAQIGKLAVEKGHLTPSQLDECLREQERLSAGGGKLRLGQILLKRGHVTTAQLLQLLGLQPGRAEICGSCGSINDQPEHAAEPPAPCGRCGAALNPPAAHPEEAGARIRIGKYIVIRQVGSGGMGTVFEARDPILKRTVALKVIREGVADAVLLARLNREAAIAAQLQHPNIVGVHEVASVRDDAGLMTHFIAMDFVEGVTLAELLITRRTPLSELLRMLEEVAGAVGFAHAKGVIHRDLKPQNVLVEKSGRALLTDFGLARAESFQTHLTQTNAIMGTPHYMAPEQAEGRAQDVGPRTDVYALGVILYEILAGRTPFDAKTPVQLYRQIVEEEPVRPSRLARSVDRDLEIICLKAISKEPLRRYPNGAAFAEDIAHFRRGEPVAGRPSTVLYRLRKAVKRRRALIATGVVVLALALGVWAATNTLGTSRRVRELLADAREHEKAGRLEKARDAYLLATQADPGNAAAGEGRWRLEAQLQTLEAGRRQRQAEALKLFEAGRPALEKAVELLYRRDSTCEQILSKVAEGQERIEEGIRTAPELAPGHYLLGRAWEITGCYDKAEQCWRKAIELDATFGPARYHLGRILVVRAYMGHLWGSADEREKVDREAAALIAEAVRQLDAAMRSTSGFNENVQRAVAEAMLAYLRDDIDKCLERVGEGLREARGADGTEELHWLRGIAANDRTSFESALGVRPKFPLALFGRAVRRAGEEGVDAAIDDYTQAIELCPGFAAAYANRGVMRVKKGDDAGAEQDYTRAVELNPRLVPAYCNRGIVRVRRGDVAGAIADGTRAIELNPRVANGYMVRGRARVVKGDAAGAIEDCTRAIELCPGLAEAYCDRGLALQTMGDFAGADQDYTRAIRLVPNMAVAYSNRSVARHALGQVEAALEDVTKALELDPRAPEAYVNRASVRFFSGDRVGAVADYEKGLEVAPPNWAKRAQVESALKSLRDKPAGDREKP